MTQKNQIKEVTCFTWGDSLQLKTWSNVPYFLTTTLEQQEIKVNRVNITEKQYYLIKFGKFIRKAFSFVYRKKVFYDYTRTRLSQAIANYIMKKSILKFPNTDLFICISFSFSAKNFTSKPVIMFCDWTIEYAIRVFQMREPLLIEKNAIKRQHNLLIKADAAITLFPDVSLYYKKRNPSIDLKYLGNVINSNKKDVQDLDEIIDNKYHSNTVLFIGKRHYLTGLTTLITAIKKLKNSHPIKLNIIGISETEEFSDPSITYYGYLNKAIPKENHVYYQLISNAKVIINTTPDWAGFSSMVESMFHYTPVIVSPYKNFIDTFGSHIKFGYYCENNTNKIEDFLKEIFALDKNHYKSMALEAHIATRAFSWDNYIEKLLNSVMAQNI